MDQIFYKEWFQGFAKGLDVLEADSRSCLLKQCAKKCADTGVLEMYQKLHEEVKEDCDAFYTRINELGGVRSEIIVPDKVYHIIFPACVCDLHTTAGINTPNLCECSRQSIIYVGEKIWGTTDFEVQCLGTILSGAKECTFKVTFK